MGAWQKFVCSDIFDDAFKIVDELGMITAAKHRYVDRVRWI